MTDKTGEAASEDTVGYAACMAVHMHMSNSERYLPE